MTHYLRRWPAPKTFLAKGDQVKGTVLAWDEDSLKYPSLHVRDDDGQVWIIRVTQTRLHQRLVELLPDQGDRIWIRYDGDADKAAPGMAKTKEFTVEVRRQGSQPLEELNRTSGKVVKDPVPEAGK